MNNINKIKDYNNIIKKYKIFKKKIRYIIINN